MSPILALAVIIIAIVVAKRMLWRHYEPEVTAEVRKLRWLDWTDTAIRVFSWLAGIALVLAAVYFARSTAHGSWLDVAIGLGAGIALLLISVFLSSRYGLTADAVDGAGIGILYVTCYAMHVRWNLVPLPVALVAMLVVTGAALFLATRRASFFIAILGLIGGFVMPALLSFDDKPLELFAYLLVLNAGMSWLAFRMRWPLLIALSVGRTAVYEWTWVLQSLTSSQLWLAALIFAAFAIVAAAPVWYRRWDDYPPRFRHIAAVSLLMPLLFAFYMAANANYGEQINVLFAFLLVIAVSLFLTVWRGGPAWLHIAGGIATSVTFLLWFWQWWMEWYGPDSWPPRPVPGLILTIAIWLGLFIALYLVRTTIFASLLFFVFIGLAIRQPEDYVMLVVVMLALLITVVQAFILSGNPMLGAIAIGLSAIAVMVLNPMSLLYATRVSHAPTPPPMAGIIIAAFAILFAALLALASILDVPVLAILAVPFYAVMLITVYAPTNSGQLVLAIVPYALFVVYAFFPGARVRGRWSLHRGGAGQRRLSAQRGGDGSLDGRHRRPGAADRGGGVADASLADRPPRADRATLQPSPEQRACVAQRRVPVVAGRGVDCGGDRDRDRGPVVAVRALCLARIPCLERRAGDHSLRLDHVRPGDLHGRRRLRRRHVRGGMVCSAADDAPAPALLARWPDRVVVPGQHRHRQRLPLRRRCPERPVHELRGA